MIDLKKINYQFFLIPFIIIIFLINSSLKSIYAGEIAEIELDLTEAELEEVVNMTRSAQNTSKSSHGI